MKKPYRLALMAMFAAVSILAVGLIRIPLIPSAPFLVYDMADIPILLATLILGGPAGGAVLLAVCFIQAFLMGGDGPVGFVMHLVSTGAMVCIFTLFGRLGRTKRNLWWAALAATLTMTAVMIPMNLWLTVVFMGTPREVVVEMLVPAIIPFNLLKAGLNSFVSAGFYRLAGPVLEKRMGKIIC